MKGIILVNMGGATSEDEVKYFLRNMFLDRNILPMPLPLRMFLSWRITAKRYQKSWKRYQDMGGTDIRISAQTYAKKLTEELDNNYCVETAFVYSHTPPLLKLNSMISQGITDITVISLFPHPCICTHGKIREDIQTVFNNNQLIFC